LHKVFTKELVSMSNANAHALASFGTPVGVGGLLRNLGTLFAARRHQMAERARIRRELESYSDRELSDLGLGRGDIDAVASGLYIR
jgi:uncharacterized protein YjiS (DUF1127 family)